MDKQALRRIRKIIDGDINSNLNPYISKSIEEPIHKEGDTWIEDNKTWTVKNGIIMTVSKLKSARKQLQMSNICPKCGNQMKNDSYNRKFMTLKNMCFDCGIKEDTDKIINGTFKDYEKEKVDSNRKGWITDMKKELLDYVDTIDNNHFITEQGDIEKWDGDRDKVKQQVKAAIEELTKIQESI